VKKKRGGKKRLREKIRNGEEGSRPRKKGPRGRMLRSRTLEKEIGSKKPEDSQGGRPLERKVSNRRFSRGGEGAIIGKSWKGHRTKKGKMGAGGRNRGEERLGKRKPAESRKS